MVSLRKLLAPLAILALAGCATPDIYAPDERYVAPALWEVADKDTRIYLFGTVHALTEDTSWYAGSIEAAFLASDEMVTEIAMNDAGGDANEILRRAILPDGQNLRDMMKPDDRVQYEEALVSLGLPVTTMDGYKPWYAAMTLALLPVIKEGFNPQTGAEAALAGKSGDKVRSALETVDQQIDLFDGLPVDAQLLFLDETVETSTSAAGALKAMIDKWLAGDASGLAVLMNEELDDGLLYSRLLTERNARWADWIKRRMAQPGTVFVAVGAGHLAGAGSVQELLRKRGVKVRRVEQ